MENGIVSEYYKDIGISTEKIDQYIPNVNDLNRIIEKWNKENILFCGIYHSHYLGDMRLSKGDMQYIKSILKALQSITDRLYFPLVFPKKEILVFQAVICKSNVMIFHKNIILV
ncbi:MAG: hypothetical protein ACLUFX_01820 [Oscillospiraceae bacterium]